jgi:FtsP/CotA-like multicopper oxidase with cupredoxin domain
MRVIALSLTVGAILGMTSSPGTLRSRPAGARAPVKVQPNDNRVPAGVLRDGVLRLRLKVRPGMWHPDGDDAPGVEMLAFAEEGRAPQIPGPLIRVPEGTEVRVTVRNPYADKPLFVHGLHSRPLPPGSTSDTAQLAPGATRELRFDAGTAGTYYYWATTRAQTRVLFDTTGAQLAGALVVDPKGARANRDRILVLGGWVAAFDSNANFAAPVIWFVNGRSWPHTARLRYATGDSVRLRIINASQALHPIHLHGFYFRVDARGDGKADTTYAPGGDRQLAFTERMPPAATAAITWVPERAGNWLLHCHIVGHFVPHAPLGTRGRRPLAEFTALRHHENHALEGMGGLVVGLEIARRRGAAEVTGGRAPRRLRLLVRGDSGGTATEPSYGYTLQPDARAVAPPSERTPSPAIVLRRGEPVSIMVVNQLDEPTSVHWHGIELESYMDGVPGYGGEAKRLTPVIAARDSFEVRFTPPRAGTFMYHTHAHELRQLTAGLAAALIVVDPDSAYDAATDVTVLVTSPRNEADRSRVLVNASLAPPSLAWKAGTPVRLRLINVHAFRAGLRFLLYRDTTLVEWQPVAKDAMPLAGARTRPRPANQSISIGETYDFAFTPRVAGDYRIEVRPGGAALPVAVVPVRVH